MKQLYIATTVAAIGMVVFAASVKAQKPVQTHLELICLETPHILMNRQGTPLKHYPIQVIDRITGRFNRVHTDQWGGFNILLLNGSYRIQPIQRIIRFQPQYYDVEGPKTVTGYEYPFRVSSDSK